MWSGIHPPSATQAMTSTETGCPATRTRLEPNARLHNASRRRVWTTDAHRPRPAQAHTRQQRPSGSERAGLECKWRQGARGSCMPTGRSGRRTTMVLPLRLPREHKCEGRRGRRGRACGASGREADSETSTRGPGGLLRQVCGELRKTAKRFDGIGSP
eukprot:2642472-Rhodomonas_salina.9